MKKSFVTLLLVFATAGFAQTASQTPNPAGQSQPSAAPGQAAPPAQTTQPGQQPATAAPAQTAQPGQQPAPAQQKKEIKDPAEYNAYMSAIQATDPTAKAGALESFVQQYSNSVMKEDALELLLRTYQQSGNIQKTEDAANRLLQVNPNNVTALALLSYTRRINAQNNINPQQNLKEAADYGERGLKALQTFPKPEGMSDTDFEKLKTQLGGIFNASVGIAALQASDYDKAQTSLAPAAVANPNDFSIVYPLALAFLNQPNAPPSGLVDGLWFVGRSVALAPTPQAKQQIQEFGRRKYIKYHGGEDGWNELLAAAAQSPTKPQGFAIKPAPTPAEQAAMLVQEKTVDKMSFDEMQMVLTSGNQQASDTVWNGIKSKPLAIEGKVISATPDTLTIAGSYDDIQQNKPDIEVKMAANIPKNLMPDVGQMLQFQGTPTSFEASPFMVHMTEGKLINPKAKASAAPKKKAPARKTGTTRRRPQ